MPVRGEDVACERAGRDGTSTGARAPQTLKSARDRAVPLVSLCTIRGSGSVHGGACDDTRVVREPFKCSAKRRDVMRVTARAARNTNSPVAHSIKNHIRLYFTRAHWTNVRPNIDNMHSCTHDTQDTRCYGATARIATLTTVV